MITVAIGFAPGDRAPNYIRGSAGGAYVALSPGQHRVRGIHSGKCWVRKHGEWPGGAAAWGDGAAISRPIGDPWPPGATEVALPLATLALFIVSVYKKELPRLTWPHIRAYLLLGLVTVAVPVPLFTFLSDKLPIGIITLLLVLVPLLTYVMSYFLRIEKFRLSNGSS